MQITLLEEKNNKKDSEILRLNSQVEDLKANLKNRLE